MTPTTLARVLALRGEVSPGGLVTVSECVESHVEADDVVWMLRRTSIGPTSCGCEIECAVVDGESWVIEKEVTGFSHYGCPVGWFMRTKAKDWGWRNMVWARAELARTEIPGDDDGQI